MSPDFHFWIDGEVVSQSGIQNPKTGKVRTEFCVDTNHTSPNFRYGQFNEHCKWCYVPFDNFPLEFKAHLLLLGLS